MRRRSEKGKVLNRLPMGGCTLITFRVSHTSGSLDQDRIDVGWVLAVVLVLRNIFSFCSERKQMIHRQHHLLSCVYNGL